MFGAKKSVTQWRKISQQQTGAREARPTGVPKVKVFQYLGPWMPSPTRELVAMPSKPRRKDKTPPAMTEDDLQEEVSTELGADDDAEAFPSGQGSPKHSHNDLVAEGEEHPQFFISQENLLARQLRESCLQPGMSGPVESTPRTSLTATRHENMDQPPVLSPIKNPPPRQRLSPRPRRHNILHPLKNTGK